MQVSLRLATLNAVDALRLARRYDTGYSVKPPAPFV
jgi:hypothetical protein